jgi:hypothetical protein
VVGVLVFIPRASKLNHGIASTELIVSKNQTKAISVRDRVRDSGARRLSIRSFLADPDTSMHGGY